MLRCVRTSGKRVKRPFATELYAQVIVIVNIDPVDNWWLLRHLMRGVKGGLPGFFSQL